jgi:hypothetical protein
VLTIDPLPAKFDRTYRARGRDQDDAIYDVNVAQLTCTCAEWQHQRAAFPAGDLRRVCAHLYDKLYSTKAEAGFDELAKLFIRYGRSMLAYQMVEDDFGRLVIGVPWPGSVRAIGVVNGKPVVVTYDVRAGDWASREADVPAGLAAPVLERMRAACPSAFVNS